MIILLISKNGMMKKWIGAFAVIMIAVTANTQSLTKTEQQILQHIETDYATSLQLLKESVNINSGTYNFSGVKKVGDLYGKELAALGFTVEWITMPDSLKRAGHLVATRKGKKGKKLFLIGHLDTVFEPDMPPNPFTILSDTTATGQGVNDMKGGDVLVIAALKALHKQGLLEDVSITVYFTGDEENAGHPRAISRGDFIERAKQHDIALGFETANGLSTVATARRGASEWRLEVEGKQAHSSGMFGSAGFGAIYEASRIINEFREKLSKEQYLTFNPGLFIGGSEVNYDTAAQKGNVLGKTNIISPKTTVIGDLRFLTEEQKEKARTNMQQIVSQHLSGTNATIFFKDGIPSMPPTPGNMALVKMVNAISIAVGYGEVKAGDPGSRGAGDISYVANYLDCLDGLGAPGRGAHAPGEIINLQEYPKLIKRAALLIYRLTR
jgi:glutamate carboxypeptidase